MDGQGESARVVDVAERIAEILVATEGIRDISAEELAGANRAGWVLEVYGGSRPARYRVVLTPDELGRAIEMACTWMWPDPATRWDWVRELAGNLWSNLWLGNPEDIYPGLAEELVEMYLEQPGEMPFWWDLEWRERLVAEIQEYVDCDLADDTTKED